MITPSENSRDITQPLEIYPKQESTFAAELTLILLPAIVILLLGGLHHPLWLLLFIPFISLLYFIIKEYKTKLHKPLLRIDEKGIYYLKIQKTIYWQDIKEIKVENSSWRSGKEIKIRIKGIHKQKYTISVHLNETFSSVDEFEKIFNQYYQYYFINSSKDD